MKEPTFKDIWNKLLLPQVGELLLEYDYPVAFVFENRHKFVEKEYIDLRTFVKDRMNGDDKRTDRHKIAAALTMAIAKIPQFRVSKSNVEKSSSKSLFESLLKMNCNKSRYFIIDYVLAWKVGLNVLKHFAIKEEEEKGNDKYISFLKQNGFSFPEISEKFVGTDYEVNAVRALYFTVPQHYVQYAERKAIFFLANMFFLVENFTKVKYNLRQAFSDVVSRK